MKIPIMRGIMDRRILANFHVDAKVLSAVLPEPFRPKLIHGVGIAGICLIRLRQLRPRFVPRFLGLGSENAAHRIAVEWEQDGELRVGVYIPRRDSSSRLNTLLGGRLFPGFHHHARFTTSEIEDFYSILMESDDGETRLAVEGKVTAELPGSSVFDSLDEASDFFEGGSLGFSDTKKPGEYHGLELHTRNWKVQSLAVDKIESSFFDDRDLFPAGSADFDCALLMRQIDHEWQERPMLCCQEAGA